MEEEIENAKSAVTEILLLELVSALLQRGSIKREDVAGALLRSEFRSEMLDDIRAEEGAITRLHGGNARLITEDWSKRLGLPPELHTLREHHARWMQSGQAGTPPLYPEAIAELFGEDDEP